jgi:mono/diheme cytochrome c family protein
MGRFAPRRALIGFRPVPSLPSTPRRPIALAIAALALAVTAAGCGGSTDVTRGRALFIQRCGTCHSLAQAGTNAQVGPDLDAAFAQARAAGEDDDTIAGVVKAQVRDPRPNNGNPSASMPPDLAGGQDLEDIAAYIGQVAGVPGIQPPKAPGGPGGQIFAQNNCASCHTLKAAQSTGTTGPNLDTALANQSKSFIQQSIVTPDAKIAPGYGAGIMPSNFGEVIPKADLKTLVNFLYDSTHKGG